MNTKRILLIGLTLLALSIFIHVTYCRILVFDVDNTSKIGISSNPIYESIDIVIYFNEREIFNETVDVDIFNAKFNVYVFEEKKRFGYNTIEVYSERAQAYNEYGGFLFFTKRMCITFNRSTKGDYYGFVISPGSC